MADPRVAETFTRLVDIMARLHGPGGCPWDREQTPASLRPFLLEEAHEVLEAIDDGDPSKLCEELGDLLLQIVFQAELAAAGGQFTVADVAHGIAEKLVRRHPHVFGNVQVRDAAEVVRNWNRIKAAERGESGTPSESFASVPKGLPALVRAEQIGAKAAHLGLDWPDAQAVLAKVHEEVRELEAAVTADERAVAERELGDLLLALTSVARHLGLSAELALTGATRRFVARARHVEAAARASGTPIEGLEPDAIDRLWMAAKAAVPAAPRRATPV